MRINTFRNLLIIASFLLIGNFGFASSAKEGGDGEEFDAKEMKHIRPIRFYTVGGRRQAPNKIKAIVMRINSGGGSAMASENIWRELQLCREAGKPVVASMSDVAASGGYYISCGADKILAERTSKFEPSLYLLCPST